jgi:catalase
MKEKKKLTTRAGASVVDNQNVLTAWPRGAHILFPGICDALSLSHHHFDFLQDFQ